MSTMLKYFAFALIGGGSAVAQYVDIYTTASTDSDLATLYATGVMQVDRYVGVLRNEPLCMRQRYA